MKKLLIVVDYQHDFVDGTLGFPKAVGLEGSICEKIKKYKNDGDEVVFTFDTHDDDYENTQEGKNLPILHCHKDTEGWNLFGGVRNLAAGCKKFEKHTFGSDELFDYLRSREYDEIEIIGVVTDICVMANVILAKTAKPEAVITVDSHCVASNNEEVGAKALEVMKSLHVQIL